MENKSALLELFMKDVLPLLLTAVGSGLVWVLKQTADWLDARGKESKAMAMGARVAHFADLVVADINATLKPDITKALEDGHLSKEEGAQLKAKALERLKALLSEHGMDELKASLGILAPQLDLYLSGLIEKAVAFQKPAVASTGDAAVQLEAKAQAVALPAQAVAVNPL